MKNSKGASAKKITVERTRMLLNGIPVSVTKNGLIIGGGRNKALQAELAKLAKAGIDYHSELVKMRATKATPKATSKKTVAPKSSKKVSSKIATKVAGSKRGRKPVPPMDKNTVLASLRQITKSVKAWK